MKRCFPLLLLLVILCCVLPVTASAAEDHLSTFNFSVTSIDSSSASGTYEAVKLRSVLYNAYFTNSAVITSCNRSYVYGYFWDEYGRLCSGAWVNPKAVNNASVLGVYPLSSLELVEFFHYYGNSSGRYIYFSKHLAESSSDFLTSNLYAVCWDDVDSASVWFCYFKSATSSTWATGAFNVSLFVESGSLSTTIMSMSKYYAADADAILWNVVPEGGTAYGSSSGVDPNTQPYISVTAPASIQKGLFVGVRAELANRGDITGDIVCFISGHNSARTFLTELESSTDGVYVWNVTCGPDENSDELTLTFMLDGRPDITAVRKISVISAEVGNEGSSGDLSGSGSTEPDPTVPDYSDEIKDGMQQIQEDERNQANSEGQDAVDQIIDIIPDESQKFGAALGSLVNLLSYEGTAAVITMPAITIPAIDGLFPEITVLEEQKVDFEFYIGMLPDIFITLTWAFFDIAIVYYCLKEFLDLIGGFSNGFANVSGAWGKLDE